jgi:hypothetical protein
VQEEMMCSMVSPSVPQILHLSMIDCKPHVFFIYFFFLKIVRKLFAMNRWLQTGTLKKQRTVTSESPEEPKPGPSDAGIILNLFKNKVTQPLVFLCLQSHSK